MNTWPVLQTTKDNSPTCFMVYLSPFNPNLIWCLVIVKGLLVVGEIILKHDFFGLRQASVGYVILMVSHEGYKSKIAGFHESNIVVVMLHGFT